MAPAYGGERPGRTNVTFPILSKRCRRAKPDPGPPGQIFPRPRYPPPPLSYPVTATALISTRHLGSVASRTTWTVVVVGRDSPKYSAHTRFRASCSERRSEERRVG